MSKQLQAMDEISIRSFNWRIIFTAGMGFFTDAYDLFIIGVVTTLLAPLWHLTSSQLALLNGASLIAAAFGAVFFGFLADRYGRVKLYGLEVLILFIGAILCACSINFWWLLFSRILVGLGIGGDYPSSAVIVSEYANRKNRGFLVLMVFAMQALGLTVGPLLASALLLSHLPADYIWRILLGLGAIPAASVFYLRRKIQETPRFLLTQQQPYEVSRVIADLTDKTPSELPTLFLSQKLLSKKWLKCLVGTAGSWFLLDVAFYGNSISSLLILKSIEPSYGLIIHTLTAALIFLVFAVPGYIMSAAYIDKIGRKPLQILGFAMMGLLFLSIGLIPTIRNVAPLFIVVFGISFFFVNFGPNATTFLIPSEIYPTNLRAKAHGISAAVGKLGAFIGALLLPLVMARSGIETVFIITACVSFAGILVSLLIPEMKAVSLDNTEVIVR